MNALIDAEVCADVTASNACEGDADAESYYETYEYKGKRVIITSGSPNHDAEEKAEAMALDDGELNPNRRCKKH